MKTIYRITDEGEKQLLAWRTGPGESSLARLPENYATMVAVIIAAGTGERVAVLDSMRYAQPIGSDACHDA